jgi:pyruvate dehydrogenase E2 component (dihydrolipoamide acetyltransferase)
MSAEITIPRLGWSMEEGVFVRWLKRAGEWVGRGDQLFLLESEKATQEIESIDEGYLRIPADAPQPGETVKVGQVIAFLMAAGEVAPAEGDLPPVADPMPATAAVAGPAARRLARQFNVPLDDIAGSGRSGQITAADVHAEAVRRQPGNGAPAPNSSASKDRSAEPVNAPRARPANDDGESATDELIITPRALRVARERDVDPASVIGSGRGGRIRERDILAASWSSQSATSSIRPGTPRPDTTRQQESAGGATPRSGSVRRTIARRMVASHQTTAPVTLTSRVDATNLVNLRKQFQAAAANEHEVVPSISDLVVKLVAIALNRHPHLNARWEDEQIVELAEIRIGVAVDAEAGLLVPVLPDVRLLGVRDIAAAARELIARARAGKLSTVDLQGGTFTVTNLGMYGIDAFTPIINPPEAAILGLGAIRREPVLVEGDRVVPREMMTLSLTFDHRIVDGAPAARFLQTLRTGLENPAAWLTG